MQSFSLNYCHAKHTEPSSGSPTVHVILNCYVPFSLCIGQMICFRQNPDHKATRPLQNKHDLSVCDVCTPAMCLFGQDSVQKSYRLNILLNPALPFQNLMSVTPVNNRRADCACTLAENTPFCSLCQNMLCRAQRHPSIFYRCLSCTLESREGGLSQLS